MLRHAAACLAALAVLALPGLASAQVNIAGFDRLVAFKQEKLGDKHYRLSGSVEMEKGDSSIYADSVEFFEDEDRAVATGNVVVTQGKNRIAADRADFNTRTQLGTFFQASGTETFWPMQFGLSLASPACLRSMMVLSAIVGEYRRKALGG